MADLASRLKECRLQKKMSMAQVAKALHLKAWQAVQQWEKGRAVPSSKNLDLVAGLYGVPIEYLLHGRGLQRQKQAKIAPSEAAMHVALAFDRLSPESQRVVITLISALSMGASPGLELVPHALTHQ